MSTASYLVTDHAMRQDPLNISFVVIVGSGRNGQKSFQATRISASEYSIQFPADQLGTQIVAVYSDGQQLPNSPFRFDVILPSCSNFPGKVPDMSGLCVCPPYALEDIKGSCITYAVILPAAIIPVCFILVAVAFFFFFRQAAREEQLWRIKEADIHWPDPPEVLGTGSSGSVYRADFRGTPVAIKRFSTPKEALAEDVKSDLVMDNMNSKENKAQQITSVPLCLESNNKILSYNAILSRGAVKENVRKSIKFLVKIRHPCITTVMGGVLLNGKELCLVMELMELGSLWDCLHNILFPMDGELALNFLHSISRGMTFLHAADPPILHGDLKSGMM
jgi:hypothetical protein